jgi:hypothetical protein
MTSRWAGVLYFISLSVTMALVTDNINFPRYIILIGSEGYGDCSINFAVVWRPSRANSADPMAQIY